MTNADDLRAIAVDAIAALHVERPVDCATARLSHATLLTAQTLERWWLPWLDDLIEGEANPG